MIGIKKLKGIHILLLIATIAIVCFVYQKNNKESWSGYIYPDKNNLNVYREIGSFSSLEECRQSARSILADYDEYRGLQEESSQCIEKGQLANQLIDQGYNVSEIIEGLSDYEELGLVNFCDDGFSNEEIIVGDYECGLNCSSGKYDFNICEETLR